MAPSKVQLFNHALPFVALSIYYIKVVIGYVNYIYVVYVINNHLFLLLFINGMFFAYLVIGIKP